MRATSARFELAFAAPPPVGLSSPHTLSRRFMMQKVQSRTLKVLPLLVDTRFQVFSLPSPGCLSPFPRGTCPLSVSQEYLGL
jgi:hypothetical protein